MSTTALICRALLTLILAVVYVQRALWDAVKTGERLFMSQSNKNTAIGKKPSALKAVSLVVSQIELKKKDIDRVVEIIRWCLSSGIRYCFVHDPLGDPRFPVISKAFRARPLGVLKQSRGTISKELGNEIPDIQFRVESGWVQTSMKDVQEAENSSVVHFLDKDDALTPLLHAASRPSWTEESGAVNVRETNGYLGLDDVDQYWSSSLSHEELKNEIRMTYGNAAVLEPDVILVAGPVFSLALSPPWHSRFSEIYYLGPLHSVHWDRFSLTLSKFWKTRQRFGT